VDSEGANLKIVGMEWYNGMNGYTQARVPCLAIGFDSGLIQIMRDERDSSIFLSLIARPDHHRYQYERNTAEME
jgi:hypothetical protein